MMQHTVLVVDDEHNFVEILRLILQRAGYQIIAAANGKEALEMAYAHRPHLIFMDDMMPGISGVDVCAALKRDLDTKHIPVILCSAGPRIRDNALMQQIGVNAVISKPFRNKEVVQMVNHWIPAPT
jgi:CheY-like chemotaxis protein